MTRPSIADVRFTPAPPADVAMGLLGWSSFELDSVRLDGVAVRRTRGGRLTLSFPVRRDSQGGKHHAVRPADDEARRAIEAAVFAALGLEATP